MLASSGLAEKTNGDSGLNVLNTHLTDAVVEMIHLKWISIRGLALFYLNKSFTCPVFIYILYLNTEGPAYLEISVVVNTLVIE